MKKEGCFALRCAAAVVFASACSTPEAEEPRFGRAQSELATGLATSITQSLQIDQIGTGYTPQDGNLHTGADPADGSASVDKPTGGPSPFIDWNDLGGALANHRLLDPNDARGRDPTSFPRSNECVGPSSVLSKMDLTYVASANNNTHAYFAVQRSNNNGDAGYYWLFTKKAPNFASNDPACRAGEVRALYDISGPDAASGTGDVLLAGHFHPAGTPLLRAFRATRDQPGVTAVAAVDFTSSLWAEDASGVLAVAVNTSITAAGAFGAAGVIAVSGGNLGAEIFAEAAVRLAIFTGGAVCGAQFYGSVITRSSGSGGTSPDLKDIEGPAVFNFGTIVADANTTVSCEGKLSATAMPRRPGQSATCAWFVDGAPVSAECNFSGVQLTSGAHLVALTMTDPETLCTDSSATFNVTVSPTLTATAHLSGACGTTATYDVTTEGGSGSFGYAWTFTDDTGKVLGTSTSKTSTLTGLPTGKLHAHVQVTDQGAAGSCPATSDATLDVFGSLTANADLKPACGHNFAYEGGASGGSGDYRYHWTFSGPGAVSPSDAFSAKGDATVDAKGHYSGTLVVTDHGRTDDVTCSESATDAVDAYDDVTATADLTGDCNLKIGYASTAGGGSGNFSRSWSFSGPGTASPSAPTGVGGTLSVGLGGTYTGTLTVTDLRSDGAACTETASDAADTWGTVSVTAHLTGGCDSSFTYLATPSGGSPSGVSYAWTFSGGIAPSSQQADSVSLGAQSAGGTAVTGTVVVVDKRGDANCPATASDTATVLSPIQVSLTPNASSASCSDTIVYSATVTGGPSAPILAWSGEPCSGLSCSVSASGFCGSKSISLAVSDGSGVCSTKTSETETYTKVTTVSASDN